MIVQEPQIGQILEQNPAYVARRNCLGWEPREIGRVDQGLADFPLPCSKHRGLDMSAPQTNIKKQGFWHRGPLIGMAAGLAFVLLLALGYIAYSGAQPDSVAEPVDASPAETGPSTAPTESEIPDPAAPAD